MASALDNKKVIELVEKAYDSSIIPTLAEYIKVPNLSPAFDKEIHKNGLQDKAAQILVDWANNQNVPGVKVELLTEPNRTSLIFGEVAATAPEAGTVLLYSHFDKQPPFNGWDADKGPYTPVIADREGSPCLYGRGGADDGYGLFAVVTAIRALKEQNIPHGRFVIIVEGSEESGSPDLPFYIEKLKSKIGSPNFIVCLDSGAGNYEQMWVTTSLRGLIVAEMEVAALKEGVHSGHGSGVIADTFRIIRMLLSRLENEQTGEVLPDDFKAQIPQERLDQTNQAAQVLGQSFITSYPSLPNVKPMSDDLVQTMLNRTWRPILTVTGADGLPSVELGGNVLRPVTKLKLSLRLPPTVDAKQAAPALIKLLESNTPYGAHVKVTIKSCGSGWNAPATAPWVLNAISNASKTFYGADVQFQGEGGSIPFMGMLGDAFPKAQFFITGVLGPNSNAHGPNEFLHIPFVKKLTSCVVSTLADHAQVKNE